MNEPPGSRPARSAASIAKLLEAVTAILRDEGAAAVSVQRVAVAAGTSKGLVHYHFADKDALLAACARRIAEQLVEREMRALANAAPSTALNALWACVEGTFDRGLHRAFLALAGDATPAVRHAVTVASAELHAAAELTIARLEALLDFHPPIARPTLATAYVALINGLALDHAVQPHARQRQGFDAFWFAVLSAGA